MSQYQFITTNNNLNKLNQIWREKMSRVSMQKFVLFICAIIILCTALSACTENRLATQDQVNEIKKEATIANAPQNILNLIAYGMTEEQINIVYSKITAYKADINDLRSEAIKNNLTTSEISQIKLGMDEETYQKISNKLDTIDHRISLAKIMKLILPALIVAFAFCIIWFNRV